MFLVKFPEDIDSICNSLFWYGIIRIFIIPIAIVIAIISIVWFRYFDIAGTYQTTYENSGYTITFNRNSTMEKTALEPDVAKVTGTYQWGFGKLQVTIYNGEKPIEETWTYKLRGDVLILNDDMLLKE